MNRLKISTIGSPFRTRIGHTAYDYLRIVGTGRWMFEEIILAENNFPMYVNSARSKFNTLKPKFVRNLSTRHYITCYMTKIRINSFYNLRIKLANRLYENDGGWVSGRVYNSNGFPRFYKEAFYHKILKLNEIGRRENGYTKRFVA